MVCTTYLWWFELWVMVYGIVAPTLKQIKQTVLSQWGFSGFNFPLNQSIYYQVKFP